MPDRVKEKLVELLRELYARMPVVSFEEIADHLIANGVTVQEGKPIEAFLHPIDTYKGLKAKYLVFKADTGKVVDNCFILRPNKDAAAVEALRAYANATDNKTLAEDIYSWVGRCRVSRPCVLAYGKIAFQNGCFWFVDDGPGGMLRLCDVKMNGFEIEVIGNIHDNPELLEVTDNA